MTSYEKVIQSFHSKPQKKSLFPEGLIHEFFNTALGYFELDLYLLNWNEDSFEFEKELSTSEISLLSSLMYQAYMERELDRIIKLNSIVGKDISLTGMGDSKRVTNARLESLAKSNQTTINKLKESSFYD
ncbi:hypothetical protein G7L40_00510 [Paenibacillus polymyxa]|uniref:Uncharacterized protein n=1 Tax=Paenibacillus polymyxa TaxID=1406 RepID=A0A378XX01_PAEPO|nr:hypothetical protein [Paenibacillus polymyxa]MBE7897192.1 hypothetical protein [Paenibacillus polymyxa]MBG9763047.1 hypothetical protein [Paenibacillus polymyxa]MCC3257558.1 hypothetical protein [Paenibacillus polymyxa]QPK51357.1 hypothetical protein G7035_00510 [Paenibacillus polymyxa]QPK56447.1 hypothetical protein G7L40_00510 [Paenibacillus polymyxa]